MHIPSGAQGIAIIPLPDGSFAKLNNCVITNSRVNFEKRLIPGMLGEESIAITSVELKSTDVEEIDSLPRDISEYSTLEILEYLNKRLQ